MILFVCTGNTCRSPLAEALARARGVDARSAGLAALPGEGAPPQAVRAARRHGADVSGHVSQAVTAALVEQAEQIWAMTPAHREALLARFPEAADRVRVLEPPVPDPFGGGDEVYEQCAQRLLAAMRRGGVIR